MPAGPSSDNRSHAIRTVQRRRSANTWASTGTHPSTKARPRRFVYHGDGFGEKGPGRGAGGSSRFGVRWLDAAFVLRQVWVLHDSCWRSREKRKAQPKRRQAAALQGKGTRPVGNKNRHVPAAENGAKTVSIEHPGTGLFHRNGPQGASPSPDPVFLPPPQTK